MKLLSVSRSFTVGGNRPGRYKIAEQGLLPKFAPVGRPVWRAPKTKSDEAPAKSNQPAAGTTAAESAAPVLPSDSGVASLVAESTTEGGAMASRPPPVVHAGVTAASAKWFRLRRTPFVNRAVAPDEIPVQAELSLDSVKPVRNDLSDADLEVVLAKPGRVVPPPARTRLFRPELSGMAWGRLTARLFGSERLRT